MDLVNPDYNRKNRDVLYASITEKTAVIASSTELSSVTSS